MPRFSYFAVSGDGEVVKGDMSADSRDQVITSLRDQGYVPIRADLAGARRASSDFVWPRLRRGRVRLSDLTLLTRTMATLLGARLPMDRVLSVLRDLAATEAVRTLVGAVQDSVKNGSTLADALEEQGAVFPAFYIGMVRAGEAGGTLAAVMRGLAETLEQTLATRAIVRSALTYPVMVLIIAGLSVIVLMTMVIPEFQPLFEQSGAALPLSTRVMVSLSDFLAAYGWLLALLLIAVLLAADRYFRTTSGRLRRDEWLLRAPLLGDLITKLEAARFGRTLGSLLQSGVTILGAIDMTRAILRNEALAQAVMHAKPRIAKGERLGQALARSGRFPSLAVHLIEVGEETGELDEMLRHLARVYDEESQRTIQQLLALLVPGLTVLLGLLVALIIGSMFSAILSAYNLPL